MSKKQRISIETRIKFLEAIIAISKKPEDVEYFTIHLFELQRRIIGSQG
jgi:hypothetical protein